MARPVVEATSLEEVEAAVAVDGSLIDLNARTLTAPSGTQPQGITVAGDNVTLRNGVLEGFALLITGSNVTIEGLTITGELQLPAHFPTYAESAAAATVSGASASATVLGCEIYGVTQRGAGARVSNLGALLAMEGAQVQMKSSTVRHCDWGVCVAQGGQMAIRQCRMHANRLNGAVVADGADLRLTDSQIWDGAEGNGLYAAGAGTLGTVVGCQIYNNSQSNVWIVDAARVSLQNCDVHGGGMYGISTEGEDSIAECRSHVRVFNNQPRDYQSVDGGKVLNGHNVCGDFSFGSHVNLVI